MLILLISKALRHIFYAIKPTTYFPIIFVMGNKGAYYSVTVIWEAFTIHFMYKDIIKPYKEGLYLYKFKKQINRLDMLVFLCKKGGHISQKFVCNGDVDCPNDHSDEDNCWYSTEMGHKYPFCR